MTESRIFFPGTYEKRDNTIVLSEATKPKNKIPIISEITNVLLSSSRGTSLSIPSKKSVTGVTCVKTIVK